MTPPDSAPSIAIDATCLRQDRLAGLERFTLNLLRHLTEFTQGIEISILIPKNPTSDLTNILGEFDGYHQSPFHSRIPTDQFWVPLKLFQLKPDLVHFPAFPPPFICPWNTLCTVHDAVHWKFPETLSFGGRYYYKPLYNYHFMSDPPTVATVSESSKADLVEYLDHPENKFHVIPEGIDPDFKESLESDDIELPVNDPKPYFLHVGTIEPRKNIEVLLRAFELFKENHSTDHDLILVGRQGWGTIPSRYLKRKDIQLLDSISDDQLKVLYEKADLYVSSSIYEGFGLPLIESMYFGTPSLVSDIEVYREVGGDTCLYANPGSPEEFCDQMETIVKNSELRKTTANKCKNRARKFDWKDTAKRYNELYLQLTD